MTKREYMMRRKKSRGPLRKNRKNTVAKLGLPLVMCPLQTGVKLCEIVDCTSMMKSRENYGSKKKRWSIKEKHKLPLFRSKQLRVPIPVSNLFLGLAEKKSSLKYQYRSLWNVTTWRLSGEAGFFFPGWLRKQTHGSGP